MTESKKNQNQKGKKKAAKVKNSGPNDKEVDKNKADTQISKSNEQEKFQPTNKTMTDSADANKTTVKEVAPSLVEAHNVNSAPPAAPGSSGKGMGVLAILVSLVALGAAGFAWYQNAVVARLSGGEQSNRIANIEQKVTDFGSQQSGVSGLIEQIQQRVGTAETGVADQVSQVKQLVGSTETAMASQISEVKQQIAKTESLVGEQISEVKQQIAKAESVAGEQIQAIRAENTEYQSIVSNQVAEADHNLGEQADTFRKEFDELAGSIESLRSELGTSVDGWALREVEHLLVMANQRLQLGSTASDAKTALSALEIADQRLKEIDNPKLVEVRQALSGEIAALSEVEEPDVTAISSSLGLLSSTLSDLPMKGTDTPDGPTRTEGSGAVEGDNAQEKIANAGKSFLSDLAGLVQVEKGGEPILAGIAPEVQMLQQAQGQLILEAAQIALVRQQGDIFAERLTAAEAWVSEYVKEDSSQAASWLQQLGEAKGASINVSYPDISGSLAALRGVIGSEG